MGRRKLAHVRETAESQGWLRDSEQVGPVTMLLW